MKHETLPTGCYDAKSAASKLGISNKQLIRVMRELNWIMNAPATKRHNLPRRELEMCGFLTTQDRYYRPTKLKDIVRINRVTIITKAGFQELKKIITPTTDDEQVAADDDTTTASSAQQEHDKCLEQLREWGLAS